MSYALFESSRAALAFALGNTRTRYAAPLMSKMMSEIKLADKRPAKRKGKVQPEPALTTARRAGLGFSGIDASAQAGMILLHFAKLSAIERATLACVVIQPKIPCSCRQPCCRGWRLNPEYADGIQEVDLWMRQQMEAREAAGKKRNAQEELHKTLIRHHFGIGLKTLKAIGTMHDVTPQTVIAHRDMVVPLLDGVEKAGWTRLDGLLSEAGIVGVCDS